MNESPSYDESIPVLTEVVAEPAPAPEPVSPLDAVIAASEAAEHAPAPPAPAFVPAATGGDDAWRLLEERLVARVLDRLQDRVELVLEDQIRTSMAPVLDHVVARLASELRDGLQHTVEQVVARAVAQELTHLQSRPL
jgi:hypothetical protein